MKRTPNIQAKVRAVTERGMNAVRAFRRTADELAAVNEEIHGLSKTCGEAIAVLTDQKNTLDKMAESNASVRDKIIAIIGE